MLLLNVMEITTQHYLEHQYLVNLLHYSIIKHYFKKSMVLMYQKQLGKKLLLLLLLILILVKVNITNSSELEGLLTEEEYQKLCQE